MALEGRDGDCSLGLEDTQWTVVTVNVARHSISSSPRFPALHINSRPGISFGDGFLDSAARSIQEAETISHLLQHPKLSFSILVAGLFALMAHGQTEGSGFSVAMDGVLDLRHWQPDRARARIIDGDWLFFWQSWIDPSGDNAPNTAVPAPLERPWFRIQPNRWPLASGLGYGSYYLKILAPETAEPLALLIPRYRRSYRAYVNGTLLAQSGDPIPDNPAAIPLHREQLIPLPDKSGVIELIIHARNRVDFLGYAPQPAKIGL